MDSIGQGLTEERERYVVLEERRSYAGRAEEEDIADGRKETERVVRGRFLESLGGEGGKVDLEVLADWAGEQHVG